MQRKGRFHPCSLVLGGYRVGIQSVMGKKITLYGSDQTFSEELSGHKALNFANLMAVALATGGQG